MEVKNSAHRTVFSLCFFAYIPLFVVAIFSIFFFDTFSALYDRWVKWDESLSHGLLIIGVFLFFLFKTLPWTAKPQATWVFILTCAFIALGSLFWFLSHTLNIYIIEQLVLLPLFALTLAAIYGLSSAITHRFLLALPIFAIPVWDQLNNLLVDLSSTIVGKLVRLIDMPAMIDGNSIFIPYGHILIADGCSGLRYFVIALAMGYIIGYMNRYSEKHMLVVLAIAGFVGLIANWIRIFILIIIGYQSEMQSSLMSDHEYFGWILFGILCVPLIYFAPVVRTPPPDSGVITNSPSLVRLALPIAALAIGPAFSLFLNPQPQVTPWSDLLSTELIPSMSADMPVPLLSPENGYRENAYVQNAEKVYIQLDRYQRNGSDEKLVPYIPHLFEKDYWITIDSYALSNAPGKLSLLRKKNGRDSVVQLQWFDVGGYQASSVSSAKILQIPALIKNKNHFMIVTLQSYCKSDSCEDSIAALQKTAPLIFKEL
jgi:exosortase